MRAIGVVLLAVLFIVGISSIPYALDSYKCSAKAKKMGMESDFAVFTGCMVKVGDHWIDIEKYRAMDDFSDAGVQ